MFKIFMHTYKRRAHSCTEFQTLNDPYLFLPRHIRRRRGGRRDGGGTHSMQRAVRDDPDRQTR